MSHGSGWSSKRSAKCDRKILILPFFPRFVAEKTILKKDRSIAQFSRDTAAGFQTLKEVRQIVHIVFESVLLMADRFEDITPGDIPSFVFGTDLNFDLLRSIDIETEKGAGKKKIIFR